MEVTKAQAAQILGCSIKKVFKMIQSGELTARKKGESKFSDWVITLPDTKATALTNDEAVAQEVHEALPPIEVVKTPSGQTVAIADTPEDDEEVEELAQQINEEQPVSGGMEDSAKIHEKAEMEAEAQRQQASEEPKKEESKSVEEAKRGTAGNRFIQRKQSKSDKWWF
jgi:hypothetical protein